MPYQFSTIEAAVEAIAAGRIVIVMDAEDRENEGDFICAAEKVTPEIVNFMITHGRGQLCMPILPEVAERLDLPPIVENNTAPLQTAFTVPVDHRSCRTGITAQERATTIQRNSSIPPASRPTSCGPAISIRWWPRKAACCAAPAIPKRAVDLARMAGLKPAGVLIEILGETRRSGHPRRTVRAGREVSTWRSSPSRS